MDELDETRTRRDIGYTGSDEQCNWHAVCLETSIECIVVEIPLIVCCLMLLTMNQGTSGQRLTHDCSL